MKAYVGILVVGLLLWASAVHAQSEAGQAPVFTRATIEQTEESLINALESNSPGLQISAAITVKELKLLYPDRSFSRFVIPLMRIVKNEKGSPCQRVVAALALHDLHSAIGDYAIARAARFVECSQMKRTCEMLTYARYMEDHPTVATADSADMIALSEGIQK
jgi:hypothetical protein